MDATANVRTAQANRYLTQLCKHFEHKLPVSHGGGEGQIGFSAGMCRLKADDDALTLHVSAMDDTGLAQLQDVVARHLLRFAFREPLSLEWRKGDTAPEQ